MRIPPFIPRKARAACVLARKQVGKPYVFGAVGPGAFDCSGLVLYVYGKQGVRLHRESEDQFRQGLPVKKVSKLREGDILFFTGADGVPPAHEGLYLGSGEFVEAPHTGAKVRISKLAGYPGYMGARRVVTHGWWKRS